MIARFIGLSLVVHLLAFYLFLGGGLRAGLKAPQVNSRQYFSDVSPDKVSTRQLKVTIFSDLSYPLEHGGRNVETGAPKIDQNLGIPLVTYQFSQTNSRGRFNRRPHEPNILEIKRNALCSGLIDSDDPDCRAIKPQP